MSARGSGLAVKVTGHSDFGFWILDFGLRAPVADRRSQVAKCKMQNAKCKNCTPQVSLSPVHPFTRSPLHLVTLSPCHLVTCPLSPIPFFATLTPRSSSIQWTVPSPTRSMEYTISALLNLLSAFGLSTAAGLNAHL